MKFFLKIKSGDKPTLLVNTANAEGNCVYGQTLYGTELAEPELTEREKEYDRKPMFHAITKREVVERYGRGFVVLKGIVYRENSYEATYLETER